MRICGKNNPVPFAGKIMLPVIITVFILSASCNKSPSPDNAFMPDKTAAHAPPTANITSDPDWPRPRSDERLDERQRMVNFINNYYGLTDPNTLEAIGNVPRHWFVNKSEQKRAYSDSPLPIGHDQTISQPFIVAYMTYLLDLDESKKVLEIGTGSGYQAAVLNEITPHVYTIELLEALAEVAQNRFDEFGYKAIIAKTGDGYKGWSEYEPFDAIIVTCAPDNIPQPLIDQLKPDGKMVIPVGNTFGVQQLILVTKDETGRIDKTVLMPVRFVPMIHKKR